MAVKKGGSRLSDKLMVRYWEPTSRRITYQVVREGCIPGIQEVYSEKGLPILPLIASFRPTRQESSSERI